MKLPGRVLILAITFGGGGLLLWKAWDGMFYFLYFLIASTLEAEQDVPRFFPDYLITVFGILLIGVSQAWATGALSSKLEIFGLLRGVLLLLSSAAFLAAVSRIRSAFQTMASSGSADPSSFASQLENTAPFFYVGLSAFLLSAILGAIGTFDRSPKSGGGFLKGIETVIWIVSVLIVFCLTVNYTGIDLMLMDGKTGSADPARLAGAISLNLKGQFAWSLSLGLLGGLAIAASALTKPVKK